LWDGAVAARDRVAAVLVDAFDRRKIDAWVVKSKPGAYPPSVCVHSWIVRRSDPESAVFDRGSISVSVEVTPHYERSHSYTVSLQRHC
jgi:hypothetical protein